MPHTENTCGSFGGEKCFEYLCLPNGLSSAPRIFTKLLKPALAFLRNKGHIVLAYIDDLYIQGDDASECQEAVAATVAVCSDLGFIIHEEKSDLVPKKEITFLGFKINSETMRISPTKDKIDKTRYRVSQMLHTPLVKIQSLAEVIGILVSNMEISFINSFRVSLIKKHQFFTFTSLH